ncbi:MAG: ATPase [Candidatus Doudnabacteria bacterium CG10_big_fil_rev_8_21_14_0_10_41_10]|uniref:ATPase n=1 Tax=Candidatus Doudnabacteria bacterium CG10_big_fil_rev_8_21_14_0_10_41_10 TaxID=1974551 RepID=A0A2H0VDJ4_9BACT|nr:MAG: ATPase [Candidatus Doudnabacteria bacterium CG10_big_fil_rev_8_21_14_0_10_41_10]
MTTPQTLKRKDHTLTEFPWYKISLSELETKLGTDLKKGLYVDEHRRRVEAYGKNTLPEEKKEGSLGILARQIRSPLVYILLVAAVITFALREFSDLIIILAAVVINVIVGFFQERKAENTLAELKKVVKFHAKVLRQGRIKEINSSDLVPGDVILLAAGDKVPADARLIEAEGLEVVEAALTGESVPSLKEAIDIKEDKPLADQENMVFMGTEIAFGKGRAVVVGTGLKTEIGKIAQLLIETKKDQTPLQESLSVFSQMLTWVVLGFAILLMVIGLVRKQEFFEMLVIAVAVAVAAIPESLLISMTVILAIGMQQILKRRGLVRHLSAAETLGSTSVICTDKTGTLTLGEMRVTSLVSASEELHLKKNLTEIKKSKDLYEILRLSLFANEAIVENPQDKIADWKVLGMPTDKALLIAAAEAGFKKEQIDREFQTTYEIPFDEKRKYAANLRKNKEEYIWAVKGAAELVLKKSKFISKGSKKIEATATEKAALQKKFEEMTRKGLRVLGVAYKIPSNKEAGTKKEKDLMEELVFVGFVGLRDPVRQEVPETIQKAIAAGIRPVIVTGDHRYTTMAVARELGMEVADYQAIEGEDLDKMDDNDLEKKIEDIKIFARVTPAHKLRIIDAWQKKGEVVAMTGDGVNDAPALKKADIGMSLGSGTEVARQASDLVLLDNNFRTIVAAVEQGRVIFNNIRKVIVYLLADSFSAVILIAGSILIGLPLPLLPAQILWGNLITDGLPNLALTVDPGDKGVMKEKPRKRTEPLLSSEMKVLIVGVGIITDLVFLGLFAFLYQTMDIDTLRTVIFVSFGINSLFYVFSIKNLREAIWNIPIFNNWKLIVAVGLGIALQVLAVYWGPLQSLLRTEALALNLWGWVLALSLIKVVAIEITKGFYRLKREA